MKISKKAKPDLVKSSAILAKLRDDEDSIMETMPPKDETKHIAYDDEHALHSKNMAEGGLVDAEQQPEEESEIEHHDSLVAAIMAKRKKMAEGGLVKRAVPNHPGDLELEEGQVDIDDNAYELPNAYYGRNKEVLKENYDSDFMDLTQPEDSNLISDEIESDAHDMISKIRSKMNKERKFKG